MLVLILKIFLFVELTKLVFMRLIKLTYSVHFLGQFSSKLFHFLGQFRQPPQFLFNFAINFPNVFCTSSTLLTNLSSFPLPVFAQTLVIYSANFLLHQSFCKRVLAILKKYKNPVLIAVLTAILKLVKNWPCF